MNLRLQRLAAALLPPILVPKAWSAVYDNAQNSPRRGPVPGASPRDARLDLTPATRRELVRRSRYLYKNSGFVRELVSSMAIYSTGDGIRPQAQSPDPDWNQRAEAYFRQWSARCEVTGRFSFEECQGLVCRGLDIDGEYFVLKTRNRLGLPVLQLIETHRVGGDDLSLATVDGVNLDAWGAPVSYRLIEDAGPREVPAFQMLHVFEPEHASAIRSVPTIQHSINHVIDEMELLALEKHAVKDNADVTRVLKNQAGTLEEGTDFEFRDGEAAADPGASNPTDLQRIVGGKLLALKPNESLESFESKRPSPTFTGFLEHLRRDSALVQLLSSLSKDQFFQVFANEKPRFRSELIHFFADRGNSARSFCMEQFPEQAGHSQTPLPCQFPAGPVIEENLFRLLQLSQGNGLALARIGPFEIFG